MLLQCGEGGGDRRWLDAWPAQESPDRQCSGGSNWMCSTCLLGLEEAALSLVSYLYSLPSS